MLDSRPPWHRRASCRGLSWWDLRHVPNHRTRSVCASCPVAGPCLRDGFDMPEPQRLASPMRAGVIGPGGWAQADEVVAAMAPDDDAGWSEVAAVILAPHRAAVPA